MLKFIMFPVIFACGVLFHRVCLTLVRAGEHMPFIVLILLFSMALATLVPMVSSQHLEKK